MLYRVAGCLAFALIGSSFVIAGMPAPLPTDYEQITRLTDSAAARVQTFSFFLMALLLCAGVVRWLWNYLQRDFPRLPRLSYGKALGVVVLWGLLFVIVLTMISGARELMTPGAWQKQGFTYKLETAAPVMPEYSPDFLRKQHLERLRTALWHFAATHDGRFPSTSEADAMPSALWEIPEAGHLRYLYVPGQRANHASDLLAYEPELDRDRRWVLRTNGDLEPLSSGAIDRHVQREP
jgi:hypothetical protein